MWSRKEGLFRLNVIPTNIYYYFFRGPAAVCRDKETFLLKFPYMQADFWSLSLIFTSPFFLLMAFYKPKSLKGKLSGGLFLLILFLNLCYFSPGFRQYGTRLLVDGLPFLYLMVAGRFAKESLTFKMKLVILMSIFVNFYLFYFGWSREGLGGTCY